MLQFLRNLLNLILNLFVRREKPHAPPADPPDQEAPGGEDPTPSEPETIMEGIDHVVVVMMENRSFDNVLGWLYEENEISGLTYIPETWNGEKCRFDGLFASTAGNYKNPYSGKDGRFVATPLEGTSTNERNGTPYFNSPPHDPWEKFEYVTDQLYGPGHNGKTQDPWIPAPMNGFLQSYASKFEKPMESMDTVIQIMEGFSLNPQSGRPGILPVMNRLARHYAVSDHWYCSVPSQTNPNRAWMACGTSEGQINNQGPQDQGTFTVPSIWEKINGSLTWKVYFEEDYFPVHVPGIVDKGKGPWTQNAFVWLKNSPQSNNVQEIQAFHRDARSGNLPKFSFIEPSWTIEGKKVPGWGVEGLQGNECHPPGDVRPGDQFLGTLYNSLIANPGSWERTLFVITFDEHGGLFDHIPPPPAPQDYRHASGDFQFNRYGVRVPTIFISPQIKEKTVFRAPIAPNWNPTRSIVPQLDHTSIPATILKWAGKLRSYGLYNRTDQAPTFEKVLNQSANPRKDARVGDPNPNVNGEPLKFGDEFYLKLQSHGYEYYLSYADKREGTYYALASYDEQYKKKVRFTFPNLNAREQAIINQQPLTHGSLLYVTSEAAPSGKPYLTIDDTDAYYDEDHKNSLNQWVIKLKSAAPGDLGQFIYDGNEIYLENRDNVRVTEWLPGKLIVNYSAVEDNPYTTTTEDGQYADPSQGIITIVKA